MHHYSGEILFVKYALQLDLTIRFGYDKLPLSSIGTLVVRYWRKSLMAC